MTTYHLDFNAIVGPGPGTTSWRIDGYTNGWATEDAIAVANSHARGTTSTGEDTVELWETPDDAPVYYELDATGLRKPLRFQTRAGDGDDVGRCIELFYERHPDGRIDIEYVPVPGPPGPTSIEGYLYHQARPLRFTPVTTDQPSATSWSVTLLDDTIPGGIAPDNDFVTEYEGSLLLDVKQTDNYKVTLSVKHTFGDGTVIVSTRPLLYRIQQSALISIPLASFNSRSQISLGSYTDQDGRTIEITQALLDAATRITVDVILERDQGETFVLEDASLELGRVTWYQLSAVVPNPGIGPEGPAGRGVQSITEANDALTVTLTDNTVEGPFPLPKGDDGEPGKDGAQGPGLVYVYTTAPDGSPPATPTGGLVDPATFTVTTAPTGWAAAPTTPTSGRALYQSFTLVDPATHTAPYAPTWSTPIIAGEQGPVGPRGTGIKSVTENNNELTVTLTNDSTEGPFPLPKGDKGDAGRGIKSVTDAANQLTVTLTDDSTEGPFPLPKGDKGDAGRGIKSVTENNDALTVTLTDDSTEGPFTLPRGPQGLPGTAGSLALTQVGSTINLTTTADTSIALSALTDIIMMRARKGTTEGNTAFYRKADLSTVQAFQVGNQATEYVAVTESGANLSVKGGSTGITLDVFNVTSGTQGPPGRGIKSITDAANELTVTLTDDSTEGPFALPAGADGRGVPAGGKTGELLAKTSDADFALGYGVWSTHTDDSLTGGGSTTADKLGIAAGGVEAKHIKAGAVTAPAIGADQVGKSELVPLQELPTPGPTDGLKIVGLKADRSAYELVEAPGDEFTPTQANLYPSVKPMLEAYDSSSTIAPLVFDDEDSEHIVKMGVRRDVITTDWVNLPVGFAFRFGQIVFRGTRPYVCIKAHTKAAAGPDNDPTNWKPLTTWAGTWAAGWYDPGEAVLHNDVIYFATAAVVMDDPAPDADTNTKWKATGSGSGGDSGGGAGHYTLVLDNKDVTSQATLVDLSSYSFAQNEVVEFVLSSTNADSTRGIGFAMPGGSDTKWRTLAGTTFSFSNSENVRNTHQAASITAVWTGDSAPTNDDRPSVFALVTTKKATLHMVRAASPGSSFTPSQAKLYPFIAPMMTDGTTGVTFTKDAAAATITPVFTPTKALLYPTVKQMPKAGNNIKITFDDTTGEWVTDARLPDEAAPNFYALDSRDVRTVKPPYSYSTTSEGWTLTPGTRTMEPGPVSYEGYDNSHPGFARDTTNSSNNYNGVDFSLANAGTLVRKFAMSTEITLANERQYSSDETLTMRVYVGGYFKTKPAADGQVIYTKTWQFTGGYQDAFHFDWELTLSQAGRIGEHDWWRCDYLWTTGSGEVVRGQIQAAKHTPSLPALGSIPKQSFTHRGTQDLDEIGAWIPAELMPQISSVSRIATFNIGDPDTTGTNAPNESDKSDVLLPTVDSTTPFMRAAQDLSRVKLHVAGNAQVGAGDVYLCSRIQGFPPTVLGNTAASSAWTIDYTAQGVMSLEDFYVIDTKGAGMGSPTATWDANPGGPKINQVIDGVFHTAALVAGINYTPGLTSELSIDDDELTEAAEAGLLHTIRIWSAGTVSAYELRGIPRPVPFGSGSNKRVKIGPLWLAGASNGEPTLITFVDAYRDIHGLHFQLKATNGNELRAWVDSAQIEYEKYTTA